jgi:hypothetical protein
MCGGMAQRGAGAGALARPPSGQREFTGAFILGSAGLGFWQIGKNLPRYPKKVWEAFEIAALYDKAIIIEYQAICYSR